ncbi:MAG: hypothetical protein CV082_03395 [Candidatus Brocadia sp. BL1]|nr:MAG: hypothetical protein CV082_03395 [Candidatus Brocadia sp. BL1]
MMPSPFPERKQDLKNIAHSRVPAIFSSFYITVYQVSLPAISFPSFPSPNGLIKTIMNNLVF